MPHVRSPSKAGEGRTVLVKGDVCRESNVADRLVNKRWMQLLSGRTLAAPSGSFSGQGGAAPTSRAALYEPPMLASFRNEGDSEPSKVWAIARGCTVGPVSKGPFHLRQDTSTLMAVVASKYKEVEMHSFTLHFGFSGLFAAESLRLCFEDEATAGQWHEQLAQCIQHLERMGSTGSAGLLRVPSDTSLNGSASGPSGASPAATADKAAPAAQARPQPEPERALRAWQSVRHVNGVAVYAEEEAPDGEGGALMVSAIVRSSPQECFEVLMATSDRPSPGMLHGDDHLLEVVDKNTQVVMHTFQPGGLLGRLCAPREMVLLRSWRQDADGTYIMLYQSTKHRKARQAKASVFNWKAPVRAQVQAAGFTVSPLLPRYTGGGPSQECLVTLVMKVDLGGWLSQRSILRRLGAPVAETLLRAWLEPMLLSVVMLRDKVEQSRFVVRPYSMGEAIEEAAETQEAQEATPPRSIGRTTTFLTYSGRRSRDLHDAERLAAGGSSAAAAAADGDGEWADGDAEFMDALSGGPSRRASHDGSAPKGTAGAAGTSHMAEELAAVRAALARQQSCEVPEDERWAVQGTAARRFWSCPGTADLRVRGRNYLTDRKKIPAAMPMFDLYSAELVEVDEPMWHMARFLPSVKYCAAPFMFILQLMVPANPPLSLTMVWTAPLNPMKESLDTLCAAWPEDPNGTVRSFFTNLCDWMQGDGPEADAARNRKFKLIPRIVKGSWIVKQSVGTTPVLLGQKLATRYFRGPNYFEVDVDITSNTVANSVTSLVVGAITSLVVDLAPLVEGQAEGELPERLIGSVRFEHLDLKTAAYLDDESGKIYKNERFGG